MIKNKYRAWALLSVNIHSFDSLSVKKLGERELKGEVALSGYVNEWASEWVSEWVSEWEREWEEEWDAQ